MFYKSLTGNRHIATKDEKYELKIVLFSSDKSICRFAIWRSQLDYEFISDPIDESNAQYIVDFILGIMDDEKPISKSVIKKVISRLIGIVKLIESEG